MDYTKNAVALYMPAVHTEKLMQCMALIHMVNNLSNCEVNLEFSVFIDVIM